MTDNEDAAIARERDVIRRRVMRYVGESGLKLQPDAKKLDLLLTGLARRKVRKGDFYCPCRVLTGLAEEDRKAVCPCDYHLKEIAEEGCCKCELFFKPDGKK